MRLHFVLVFRSNAGDEEQGQSDVDLDGTITSIGDVQRQLKSCEYLKSSLDHCALFQIKVILHDGNALTPSNLAEIEQSSATSPVRIIVPAKEVAPGSAAGMTQAVHWAWWDDETVHTDQCLCTLEGVRSVIARSRNLPASSIKLYVFTDVTNQRTKLETDLDIWRLGLHEVVHVYLASQSNNSPNKYPLRIQTRFNPAETGSESSQSTSSAVTESGSAQAKSSRTKAKSSPNSAKSTPNSAKSLDSGDSPRSPSSGRSKTCADLVKERDGEQCLLTGLRSACECCHIIPVYVGLRRHTVPLDVFQQLLNAYPIVRTGQMIDFYHAGKITVTHSLPSVDESTAIRDSNHVTYQLEALTSPANPFHGLFMHHAFNRMFDNGKLWFEVYDKLVHVFFHSTVENTDFPYFFSRDACHGAPIMNLNEDCMYARPSPELFQFHRVFHAAAQQAQSKNKLTMEALLSHEHECKFEKPIAQIPSVDEVTSELAGTHLEEKKSVNVTQ